MHFDYLHRALFLNTTEYRKYQLLNRPGFYLRRKKFAKLITDQQFLLRLAHSLLRSTLAYRILWEFVESCRMSDVGCRKVLEFQNCDRIPNHFDTSKHPITSYRNLVPMVPTNPHRIR